MSDYPEWTLYSGGNPRSYRRIYCGRLLYVIPHGDYDTSEQYAWMCGDPWSHWGDRGTYETREAAQEAAEKWAAENGVPA